MDDVQIVSIARSQGLRNSFCVSSSGNFLCVWLHSSCSMAQRPGNFRKNFLTNLATELLMHSVQGGPRDFEPDIKLS